MALIHIIDKQTDEILGTLNHKKAEVLSAIRKDTIDNKDKLELTTNAKIEKAALLAKRNKVVIQDEDGFFREYRIFYAEQDRAGRKKLIIANASYTDLGSAKVIYPQTLQGATAATAADTALLGTKWQAGIIEYAGIRTIVIENYTYPLDLLKMIAAEFGLEPRFRIEVDGNKVTGRYVDMIKPVTVFEGTEVEVGKNLLGLRRKENSLNIVTALLGVGPEREDGTRLTVLVEDQEALQRWGENGQHIVKVYTPETSDLDMTLEKLTQLTENELKKRLDAVVLYEADIVATEHILGKEHKKIRVGKTFRIKDPNYQPTLYLEARVQEVERDQLANKVLKTVIGNFVEFKKEDLENQITVLKKLMAQKASNAAVELTLTQLEKTQAELDGVKNNIVYKVEIISSNGNHFKNGDIKTVLEARVYHGAIDVTATIDANRFRWTRVSNDNEGDTRWNTSHFGGTKSITITPDDVHVRATFNCEIAGESE